MAELFTIGYTAFPEIKDFIETLKKYNITSVIDVRSEPFSEYYVQYNKNSLILKLKAENILYANFREEFGARQTNINFFTDGILDFEKFYVSDKFQSGFLRIKNGLKKGYNIAFMCAEKYPETCHRNIMVARYFYQNGYDVKNILADNTFKTQKEMENILLDKYFPNRAQLSLFENLSTEEMVVKSYEMANREIGFKFEDI